MKLYIAEKPSLAQAIADVLDGPKAREDGAIRVRDGYVTWCYGHMLEQAPPDSYDPRYKRWSLQDLPILPRQWKLLPRPDAKQQLKIIGRLLKQATEIIHAGDPDREGQLLVDEVLLHFGCTQPVKRLLLNATEPTAVRRALAAMRDNREFQGLYEAALCRQRADWLIGMNLSRAVTKALSDDRTVSIGRVQTPTLALVVRRDLEIENFVPKPFWEIEATVQAAQGQLTMNYAPRSDDRRLWTAAAAQAALAEVQSAHGPLQVLKKRRRQAPPPLHTLPSLQKLANKQFKWPAAKTLKLAQALYEKKILSYPRTECPYLRDEHRGDVPATLRHLARLPGFDQIVAQIQAPLLRDAVFATDKVEEHHAIVPTLKPADLNALNDEERRLYGLVVERYLLMLLPDFEYEETRVSLDARGLLLSARGITPLVPGWRAVAGERVKETLLPPVGDGEVGQVQSAKLIEKQTTSPEPYTEGTLLEDMGAVAKYVEDARLKQVLKETSGLGTAATQADTIETLKLRGYIAETPKTGVLRATQFGRSVILTIPKSLSNPGVTALWEDALDKITRREMSPADFMARTYHYQERMLRDVLALRGVARIEGEGAPRKGGRKAGGGPASRRGNAKPQPTKKGINHAA